MNKTYKAQVDGKQVGEYNVMEIICKPQGNVDEL
jgi:hypothetical protein